MITAGPDFRPPPQLGPLQLVTLYLVLQTILEFEAEFGGDHVFTSWFRSAARNNLVGGVRNSRHLTGLAIDVADVTSPARRIACGLGSVVGLCREPRIGELRRRFMALVPGITQAVLESDHTHFELDFG